VATGAGLEPPGAIGLGVPAAASVGSGTGVASGVVTAATAVGTGVGGTAANGFACTELR
jgi:hypothetical protein